jgi:hypothetical protein
MKFIFLSLFVISTSAFSAEFLELGDKSFQAKKLNSSRWVFDMGADYFDYQAYLPSYKLGTFFNKTIESSSGKASEDVDLDLASNKDDHQVLGAQASLDINYLVETSVINLQPFIGMAVGRGQSNFTKVYRFEGLSGASLPAEDYKVSSEETFNFTKATVGLKLISKTGFLSFIQASQINYVKENRKLSGKIDGTKVDSATNINEENSTIIGTIGFGYLF